MSCNGNCGCSCKEQIKQLKFELSETLCQRDVVSYGADADRVIDCISSGNCVCEMNKLLTEEDLYDESFLKIIK